MSVLVILALLFYFEAPGSRAVTPLFVQKGKAVRLEVMGVREKMFILTWRFNQNNVLMRFIPGREPVVSNVYTGRIDFSEDSYSMTLKNVQEADSGLYTARVMGAEQEKILAGYSVTVQDAVSPVELKADSVSSSTAHCNITATCSAVDSDISATFRCVDQTCSQEGGERSKVMGSGASLHLYLADESIICNHSNQVSRIQNQKKIQHFCTQHSTVRKPKDSMMSFLVILLLLFSIEAPGSPAVTPVFVQKGKDVLLEVMEADVPQDFVIFQWLFNAKDVLITFQPGSIPKPDSGRIELSGKSYSVTLKNLQEADSGVYTARVTGTKENRILREYNVTVQDAVSPVKLKADSVSNSSETCNITVTCSTADSDISATFRCVDQTCSQEGGERSKVTASGAFHLLYLADESIICNHSNQASSVKDEKKIFDFCPRLVGSESCCDGVSFCLVKTVVFSVGLVIMVSAVISVHFMEKLKKKE